jgi:hypothetical protein
LQKYFLFDSTCYGQKKLSPPFSFSPAKKHDEPKSSKKKFHKKKAGTRFGTHFGTTKVPKIGTYIDKVPKFQKKIYMIRARVISISK